MTIRKSKPSTVLRMWEKEVAKLKAGIVKQCEAKGIKGREKSIWMSKASSKLAKQMARKAGMKSMGEVKCAADLEKRKIKYKYEDTTVEYQHKPQKYTPDFDILRGKVLPTGAKEKIHIEYKGKLDYETRKKLLAVRASNPDMVVCIVFEKANNKIRKGSKTTYGMWAESKGFLWSEHTVKREWI